MTATSPARKRAEALRRKGYGYLRIANLLGLDRDQVRRWTAPTTWCRCGGRKDYAAKHCRSCAMAAGRAANRRRLATVAGRYAAGESTEAMATDLGISTRAVHNLIYRARKLGLSAGPPRKTGPKR